MRPEHPAETATADAAPGPGRAAPRSIEAPRGGDHRRLLDDRGLASQIRLDPSKRVVSVPSPGQIDGSSIAWSPDRVHLAMIAQLEDRCTAGARAAVAVFVVDAATGVMRSVERATGGLAVEWLADGRLAVAGDHGVSVYDLDHPGTAAVAIRGATDLITPRRVPRCVPVETSEPAAGSAGDDDLELASRTPEPRGRERHDSERRPRRARPSIRTPRCCSRVTDREATIS